MSPSAAPSAAAQIPVVRPTTPSASGPRRRSDPTGSSARRRRPARSATRRRARTAAAPGGRTSVSSGSLPARLAVNAPFATRNAGAGPGDTDTNHSAIESTPPSTETGAQSIPPTNPSTSRRCTSESECSRGVARASAECVRSLGSRPLSTPPELPEPVEDVLDTAVPVATIWHAGRCATATNCLALPPGPAGLATFMFAPDLLDNTMAGVCFTGRADAR